MPPGSSQHLPQFGWQANGTPDIHQGRVIPLHLWVSRRLMEST